MENFIKDMNLGRNISMARVANARQRANFISLIFISILLSCNNNKQSDNNEKKDKYDSIEISTSFNSNDTLAQADTTTINQQYEDSVDNEGLQTKNIKQKKDKYLEPSFTEEKAYRSKSKLFSNKRKTLTDKEKMELSNICLQLESLNEKVLEFSNSIRRFEIDSVLMDSLFAVYSIRIQLYKKILDNENSWDFNFNAFSDIPIKIMESKDKKLRSYSWFELAAFSEIDLYYNHFTILQFVNAENEVVNFELKKDYYYYEINELEINGEVNYMFFGYDREEKNKYAYIDVFKIVGDSVVSIPCLEYERDMDFCVRRGYSFDLSYNFKTKILQHNKMNNNGLWNLPLNRKVKYKLIADKFINLKKLKQLSGNEIFEIENAYEKLRKQYELCNSIKYSLRYNNSDNYDSLDIPLDTFALYANNLFSMKNTWNYPFDNTYRNIGIKILYSEDNRLRVITLPDKPDPYSNTFDVPKNHIQFKDKKSEINHLKIDSSMQKVYKHHKIIHFYYNGIIHFLFYSSNNRKPFVQVFKIDGDSLVHIPFFSGENGDLHIWDFSRLSYDIKYVSKTKTLQLRELKKAPFGNSIITDRKIEFKLSNGKFVKIEDK